MRLAAIVLLLLGALGLSAQVPDNKADISGTGSAVQLKPNAGKSNAFSWLLIYASPANATTTCGTGGMAGCPRVGGANVSTTEGTPLVPGAARYYPCTKPLCLLSDFYYLVQVGDVITVEYGQ